MMFQEVVRVVMSMSIASASIVLNVAIIVNLLRREAIF